MNLIEQDGELYFATGEVRCPEEGEFYLDDSIREARSDALLKWPIYRKLDKATVRYVLDVKPEGSKYTLREYLTEAEIHGDSEAGLIGSHLERLEK